jgi:hypothetical protein
MNARGYTVLGWIVYQVGYRVIRRKVAKNRAKLGAAATVGLVLLAGVAVAKATAGED